MHTCTVSYNVTSIYVQYILYNISFSAIEADHDHDIFYNYYFTVQLHVLHDITIITFTKLLLAGAISINTVQVAIVQYIFLSI